MIPTRLLDGNFAVRTAVTGTVLIAAFAFWLSFTALSDLARRSGVEAGQAWAWPLIVDGLIVVATVAVVALDRCAAAWYPWPLLIAGTAVSVAANTLHATVATAVGLPWSVGRLRRGGPAASPARQHPPVGRVGPLLSRRPRLHRRERGRHRRHQRRCRGGRGMCLGRRWSTGLRGGSTGRGVVEQGDSPTPRGRTVHSRSLVPQGRDGQRLGQTREAEGADPVNNHHTTRQTTRTFGDDFTSACREVRYQ